MALAFDSASNRQTGTAPNFSWSHTCTGTNLVLLVNLRYNVTDTITSVKYNGVSMTQVGNVTGSGWIEYFYILAAPATGTNTVAVVATGTAGIGGASASYTGAAQTGQPDAFNTLFETNAASGNHTVSVNVVAANSWIVSSCYLLLAVPDGNVNNTLRSDLLYDGISDTNGPIAAGAYSVGYHWSAIDTHTIFAVSIAPFVSATITNNNLGLMGVGS